jgi:hypothetical protein
MLNARPEHPSAHMGGLPLNALNAVMVLTGDIDDLTPTHHQSHRAA